MRPSADASAASTTSRRSVRLVLERRAEAVRPGPAGARRTEQHRAAHAALSHQDLVAAVETVRTSGSATPAVRLALELPVLTAPPSAEVRLVAWGNEMDAADGCGRYRRIGLDSACGRHGWRVDPVARPAVELQVHQVAGSGLRCDGWNSRWGRLTWPWSAFRRAAGVSGPRGRWAARRGGFPPWSTGRRRSRRSGRPTRSRGPTVCRSSQRGARAEARPDEPDAESGGLSSADEDVSSDSAPTGSSRSISHVKAETARAVRQPAHPVRTRVNHPDRHQPGNDNPCDRVLQVLGPPGDIVPHMRALPHRDVAAAVETVQRRGRLRRPSGWRSSSSCPTAGRASEVRLPTWDKIDTAGHEDEGEA